MSYIIQLICEFFCCWSYIDTIICGDGSIFNNDSDNYDLSDESYSDSLTQPSNILSASVESSDESYSDSLTSSSHFSSASVDNNDEIIDIYPTSIENKQNNEPNMEQNIDKKSNNTTLVNINTRIMDNYQFNIVNIINCEEASDTCSTSVDNDDMEIISTPI